MIELEIREKATRETIGIIDTAQSIIWESQYYGVGNFEIYVAATPATQEMLKEGNYVTRQDNFECGVIEFVNPTNSVEDGSMLIASGRFVKSILDRRVVFSAAFSGSGNNYIWHCAASVLQGNVEGAIRKLIYDNAINATGVRPEVGAYRNIPEIFWTDEDISGIAATIITEDTEGTTSSAEKQVTYKNLLTYTDSVLKEYSLGARMWLDRSRLKFRYKIYQGEDRSRDSTTNEPIIFSTEFDNLISSSYTLDTSTYKNTALIGGDGEGTERKCAFVNAWKAGLDRRETFVDASSMSSTYEDEDGTEQAYTNEEYRKQLEAQGRQTLAELQKIETFNGEIDLTNNQFVYGEDFNLGDIVTVEDNRIGKYINARIITVTEVQNESKYKIEVQYGV